MSLQLAAWRHRREGNIRALLPALDQILWPELEWTPINLSELVTPQQVKIRYMKAINKVHPDKVRSLAADLSLGSRGGN